MTDCADLSGLIGLLVDPTYGSQTKGYGRIRYAYFCQGQVTVGVENPDGNVWERLANGMRLVSPEIQLQLEAEEDKCIGT